MPSRDWRLRIEDILDAINKIQRYTRGMTLEDFRASDIVMDAVIQNLGVIGEAARYVPAEVQSSYANIPWDKMRGIRNVIIHEYFGISISIVWQTTKEDLPPLVPLLQRVLNGE